MRLCFLIFTVACSAVAQQTATGVFYKAPPAVDEALRGRVTQFYQAHVDGKFRLADAIVAEDSKDAFFAAEKRRYLGFDIVRINYAENYTKATVVTAVKVEWSTPRTGKMIVSPPMNSLWKVENGDWFWYTVPQTDWDTPFGKMKPGADSQEGAGSGILGAFRGVDATTVLGQVTANRNEIRLSSYQVSSETVTIENKMPGDISLRVIPPPPTPGLTVKLEKEVLKAGESAQVTFSYQPPDPSPKPTVTALVQVSPSGKEIPVRIQFALPPEIEKHLPKAQ